MFETILTKGTEPARWLIVAGIAYTLATTIWTFFETPVTSPVQQTAAVSEDSERPPGNINWILAKHLFGEAGAAPVVVETQQEAVQTRLPLELQGVFVADIPEESSAIVAQRGKSGLRYTVGDNLPGNAELVEVHTDRIILRRAGAREALSFPKAKVQIAQQAQAAIPDDDILLDEGDYEDAIDAEDMRDEPLNAADMEDVVSDYTERLAEDAAGTLEELGVETVEGGGYRIGDVAQSPYLQQTGLQPGDIILSVNGQPLGDIERDQLEIENIMAQGSARIEVRRGERRFFITASVPRN